MKIAITYRLPEELEAVLVGDNVLYRPDLASKGPHALTAMLTTVRPDVLVQRAPAPSTALRDWRAAVGGERPLDVIYVEDETYPPAGQQMTADVRIHRLKANGRQPSIEALVLAENINTRRLADGVGARRALAGRPVANARVAMVGGGIVNLITAYVLAREGCRIDVFDAGPDPSSKYEWRKHGCTFGGGDARIFSFNEGRHHHHKGLTVSPVTNTQFQRPIGEGGWLSRPVGELNEADRRWIEEFERVPPWLSGTFDRDIISFNIESHALWRRMMAESPQLFTDVGFRDGLLRLYSSDAKFQRAKATESDIGALKQEIDLATLVRRYPSLRASVEHGRTAGALEVVGFSVNVQKFGRALVRYLRSQGVAFHWSSRVNSLLRDDHGAITGVQADSEVCAADHYVMSAGAFGGSLLAGFDAHQKIAPVIGMWLMLADQEPKLERPLKIARSGYASDGAAEGANVISGTDDEGRDVIHVSSGHGFIGSDLDHSNHAALADLARAVHDTAQDFFPAKYSLSKKLGLICDFSRYCIRPWTPSGLGIFETAGARGGGLTVLTGGHNTGGFAQSPSVAQAVLAALSAREHPMHVLYNPRRFDAFVRTDGPPV